jgi:phosphate transport system protein
VGLVGEVRRRFHEELRALESEVQRIGVQARLLLEKALQALTHRDVAVSDAVISGDDEVDELYLDVERRILGLFALQTPVASDLRLLTALVHINLHLERIADQAVNMAKITKLADGLPQSPKVLQHLEEMGALATPVTHPQQVSKQSEPLLAVPWRRRGREDPGPSWCAPLRR